jgi:hypothetical protein
MAIFFAIIVFLIALFLGDCLAVGFGLGIFGDSIKPKNSLEDSELFKRQNELLTWNRKN